MGKGFEDMNGSTKGNMHVVGGASSGTQTHHIYEITSEVGSTSTEIWACGGLPENPPPHEVWNTSRTPRNHLDNRLNHRTIKCMIPSHAIRS